MWVRVADGVVELARPEAVRAEALDGRPVAEAGLEAIPE